MSPNTLALLLKVRMAGGRPASNVVWIDFSDDPYHARQRYSWLDQGEDAARVVIPTNANVDLLDLRCLVGLNVYADADTWTDRFGRLVERIKALPPRSLLVTMGDAIDAMDLTKPETFGGFAWLPSMGDITFNEWCSAGCGQRPCN